MANPGRLRMLAAALLAGVCLAAAAADAPWPDIKDAYGPLEYESSDAQPPSRKLPGGLIATGFCTMGFYWLVRRRRRLRRQARAVAPADIPLPDERLLAREAGEFYAHLTDMLRQALADAGQDRARARTPREMSAGAPGDEDAAARWQAFWARAEAAEYAAAQVAEAGRRADLAFVTELLKQMRAPTARGGGGDAV